MSEASIQVQSVLFHMDVASVERALDSLNRSVELAKASGAVSGVTIAYGDGSPVPTVDAERLQSWRDRFGALDHISYDYFGENLGSAAGHNRIAQGATADYLLIANPDVVPAPRAIEELLCVYADSRVGIVEAKQIPIEHPKDYDVRTGATSWCATAFALIPRSVFEEVGGFDAATFFLYCDDVDFSWQVRLSGRTAVHQPSAVVFHDKRVGSDGSWQPTSAERYFAAEAGLLLPYKWSRDDLVENILNDFDVALDEIYHRAAAEFRRRQAEGALPKQVDQDDRIGEFIAGHYATHRFSL